MEFCSTFAELLCVFCRFSPVPFGLSLRSPRAVLCALRGERLLAPAHTHRYHWTFSYETQTTHRSDRRRYLRRLDCPSSAGTWRARHVARRLGTGKFAGI